MSTLLYNVSGLVKEPVGATREYAIDDEVAVDRGSRRLAGHAKMLRTPAGVLLSVRLSGIEHEACSRCLRDVELPIELAFDEEFFSTADARTGAPLPPPEDADAFRIDGQQQLALDEAVRQWWAATVPMQPLCRPECAGLCARCGKDLNDGPCACPPEDDQRWAALGQLANNLEGK
jgi:uncharacterized protein